MLLLSTDAFLAVRAFTIRRTYRTVRYLSKILLFVPSADVTPEDIVWSVEAVSPFLPDSVTCLRQAMVTQLMLDRHGYDACLRLGVLKAGDELQAHAWVERDGRVVVGALADLSRYTRLPTDEDGFL